MEERIRGQLAGANLNYLGGFQGAQQLTPPVEARPRHSPLLFGMSKVTASLLH